MNDQHLDILSHYAFQVCPTGAVLTSDQGKVVGANERFATFLTIELSELIGRNLNELFPITEVKEEGENYQLKPTSPLVIAGSYIVNAHFPQGRDSNFGQIYFIDVAPPTVAKYRADKLASLGTLSGEIAHDLNNLLTGILGHVSYLRLALSDQGSHVDSVSSIEEAARLAANMTQRILKFASGERKEFCSIRIAKVVEECCGLLRAALPKNITLNVSGLDNSFEVLGDESALHQVVMNLIVNARDAIKSEGEIEVSLAETTLRSGSNDALVRPKLPDGSYVELSVKDNGSGMAPETIDRAFEPFFTTKVDTGTGLGLATVHAIVAEHRGGVRINSVLNEGTLFEIFFPKQQEKTRRISKAEPQLPSGTEKILIVDDEDSVRIVMQRGLELLGYQVVTAAGGLEAVQIFKSDSQFDLVILDMMMPKMGGDEVFLELKKINNAVKVLIASGYSSDGRTNKILDNGGMGFLQKPFGVEDLARKVRSCIETDLNVA